MKDFPIPVVTELSNNPATDEDIARQWMADSASTATAGDFRAHMNLISKEVTVHGVPKQDTVRYDDWYKQCEQEFADGTLESVSYQGFKIVTSNDNRIMFKTVELLKPRDGKIMEQGIEVIIQREEDGIWRVRQERLLTPEEIAHDGIPETV